MSDRTSTSLEPNSTEHLRALLDERGVEWSSSSGLNSRFADSITFIGNVAVVSEIDGSDLLHIYFDGTPEQAVEATLGPGTCRVVDYEDTGIPVCSVCGAVQPEDFAVYYCWCCGRKVVDA